MTKSLFFKIAFFLIVYCNISAFEVIVLPLKVYAYSSGSISGKEVSEQLAESSKYLRYSDSNPISSLMEASSYCDREGVKNLLFGFLTGDELQESLELRFYDHESRTVKKVLFASDSIENTERLILNITEKVNNYISDDLGYLKDDLLSAKPEILIDSVLLVEEDSFQVEKFVAVVDCTDKVEPVKSNKLLLQDLTIPVALGYWTTIDRNWHSYTSSIFSIRTGVLVDPFEKIIERETFSLGFRFGLSLLYELAINSSDYETFTLHKFILLAPAELNLLLLEKHNFSVFLAPLFQMDILGKKRSYSDPSVSASVAPGFSTGVSYQYVFNNIISGGVSMSFDFSFYDTVHVAFRPEISVLLNLSSMIKGNK